MSAFLRAGLAMAIIACVASGQVPADSQERALSFGTTTPAQKSQEIVSAIRGLTDIPQASYDDMRKAVTLRGTSDQIAMAEWLFHNLSGSVIWMSATPLPIGPEYKVGGAADDVVRMFYPENIDKNPNLQELVNVLRTVGGFQRMFACEPRAVAMRGTAGQVALAGWLVNALDKPAGWQPQESQNPAWYEYWNSPPPYDKLYSVRVFYTAHTETQQDLQQIVNLVRTLADLQRLFAFSADKALVFRGTPGQTALAEWLLNTLDKPAGWQPPEGQNPVAYRYKDDYPGSKGETDFVRVFYLASTDPKEIQATVNLIRTETRCQRVFAETTHHAVAIRGTASQVAMAEQLVATHPEIAPR